MTNKQKEPLKLGYYWLKSHGEWEICLKTAGYGTDSIWSTFEAPSLVSWQELDVEDWVGPLQAPK